jgi:hypothetical protein
MGMGHSPAMCRLRDLAGRQVAQVSYPENGTPRGDVPAALAPADARAHLSPRLAGNRVQLITGVVGQRRSSAGDVAEKVRG